MKLKIIDYNHKYDKKLKKLYMTNITRTAVPESQTYQNKLYEKYGPLFMRGCYFIFGILLFSLFSLIINTSLAFIAAFIFIFVFIQRAYVIILVKILIYYYCFNVFVHDFKDVNAYYGKNNNKLWLAINEENDDVLGVAALDTDRSLLDDLKLWDVVLQHSQIKKQAEIRTCELKRMSVSPKAQGLGIGRTLTEAFLDYAQKKGFNFAYLTTYKYNQAAIKLYSSTGFYHAINFPFDKAHQILNLEVAFMVKALNNQN